MFDSKETSAETTHDQVKLVKVNPKDEALFADESGSSSAHSHQCDTNCDQCWQHCLYNATRKVFRDFDKQGCSRDRLVRDQDRDRDRKIFPRPRPRPRPVSISILDSRPRPAKFETKTETEKMTSSIVFSIF